jgi:hypothetical protein
VSIEFLHDCMPLRDFNRNDIRRLEFHRRLGDYKLHRLDEL